MIAFECVTGRKAFEAETLGEMVYTICAAPIPRPSEQVDCPPAFDAWFARAAARDLQARFPTIVEAAQALVAVAEGTADAAGVVTAAGTSGAPARPSASPAVVRPLAPKERADALRVSGSTSVTVGLGTGAAPAAARRVPLVAAIAAAGVAGLLGAGVVVGGVWWLLGSGDAVVVSPELTASAALAPAALAPASPALPSSPPSTAEPSALGSTVSSAAPSSAADEPARAAPSTDGAPRSATAIPPARPGAAAAVPAAAPAPSRRSGTAPRPSPTTTTPPAARTDREKGDNWLSLPPPSP
ncbi:MAG: hypothetical protein JW751_24780 [Polyangiaceae bacterium]|nr:hypothetical protein [Polyangiaceae bacterium]